MGCAVKHALPWTSISSASLGLRDHVTNELNDKRGIQTPYIGSLM